MAASAEMVEANVRAMGPQSEVHVVRGRQQGQTHQLKKLHVDDTKEYQEEQQLNEPFEPRRALR
jgi:ABC-type sulfate transport system permease subunit